MILVLMGVSGCGKTTVGKILSEKLGLPFYDGDDFHPEVNIRKMESGEPLSDLDRKPWLHQLADKIKELNSRTGGIIACSALKKSYRNTLQNRSGAELCFIHLKGPKELIAQRLSERNHHFMPSTLLDSQFEALEEPENAIIVSITNSPEEIVSEIITQLKKATSKRNHEI